jgi:uncharacterized damage-inducible protein DinB
MAAEMNDPILTAHDVVAWLEKNTAAWREFFTLHPELLAVSCDVAGVHTVAELLQHIVAVELRYAERLADLPATDYAAIPFDSVETIYATHERAMALYQQCLSAGLDWNESIVYTTRMMGPARSARKTVLFHAFLHGMRHYAQLATLVRHHGVKPGWPMDYLVMDIQPA